MLGSVSTPITSVFSAGAGADEVERQARRAQRACFAAALHHAGLVPLMRRLVERELGTQKGIEHASASLENITLRSVLLPKPIEAAWLVAGEVKKAITHRLSLDEHSEAMDPTRIASVIASCDHSAQLSAFLLRFAPCCGQGIASRFSSEAPIAVGYDPAEERLARATAHAVAAFAQGPAAGAVAPALEAA